MPTDISKAVVLARGLGTRMRREDPRVALDKAQSAAARAGLKAMIPVGRPFLDYVLGGLADAAYGDICLVIGPEHRQVEQYYAEQAPTRLRIQFAIQREPRGTADAAIAAEPFTGSDEFLVINSDNYYPVEVLRTLREMGEPGAVMFPAADLVRNSNIPDERVRAFACAIVGRDGYLKDLIEKPDDEIIPGTALVSMNCWRFSPRIFDFCRNVALSPRGEYELPLAVHDAVHAGMPLRVLLSSAGVLDLSRRADIAEVAAWLKNVEVRL